MRSAFVITTCAWLAAAVAYAQEAPAQASPSADQPEQDAVQLPSVNAAPSATTDPGLPPATPPAAPEPSTPPPGPVPPSAAAETQASAAATASTPAPATAAPAAHVRSAPQIGLAPGTPQTGTLDLVAPPAPSMTTTPTESDWKFDFHGFLRAPLRLGMGSGKGFVPEAGSGLKLHAPPQIPDGTFTDWRYTNSLPGPWAELRFSYGNTRVTGNVLIAAYNLTDGSYRDLQSQLGINQAFVTLNEADLLGDKGGLIWNVGVFQNRYGAAGRYDAGAYETYLFGRTHVAGETLTGFYNLSDSLTLTLEHGVGAKLEAAPLVSGLPEPNPAYLPYAGPVQQGTQLVHHAHAALSYADELVFGAHYLTTWTNDARLQGEVDGRITVAGADARLTGSRYGDGYIGFAHLASRTPLRVGEGLEVLHSLAGWNLRDNFFGQSATGSGTIDSLLWQYTFSFARFLRHPEPFWGQGPDVLVSVFGMFNHVGSDDPMWNRIKNKLKWGGEVTYTFLGFLGVGGRYDQVRPDLSDSAFAFHALSPKLILRSQFVSHEQIVLQYTHYLNGDKVSSSWPTVGLRPDRDALMLSAIMWW
jgi:hypothetical protein